jgi:AraC-like DNA-binding protein
MPVAASDALRARLLERLQPFASSRRQREAQPGLQAVGPQLFRYCALAHERIVSVSLDHPVIGIVMSGSKEVWLGATGERIRPGEPFVFPGGVALDVVNVPDERSGHYESLLMEVRALPPGIAPPADVGAPTNTSVRLPLSADLIDALGHAATALSASDHALALAEHRLAEVLLVLRGAPAARPLFGFGLVDRIRWMIAEDPSRAWAAGDVAARLGLGASTLRRRLAERDLSFRAILAETRMRVANDLLAAGGSSVAEAADAAGYASRSHFARRFRAAHGRVPSAALPG